MKRSIIILIGIFLVACISYYVVNFLRWNDYDGTIEGYLVCLVISTVGAKFLFSDMKFSSKPVYFIIVILVSFFISMISIRIGDKQAEYGLKQVKHGIDRFFKITGTYPEKLIEVKRYGYIKGFYKPVFLKNGNYLYRLNENKKSYELRLETDSGLQDFGIQILNDNKFEYYDF